MKINVPALKHLVFDVLTFTDEVDEKGIRLRRTSYAKAHAASVSTLKTKLLDDVRVSDTTQSKWYTRSEAVEALKENKDLKLSIEKFTTEDIELSPKELAAFKFLYNSLDEIADYGTEAFDLLEQLLK